MLDFLAQEEAWDLFWSDLSVRHVQVQAQQFAIAEKAAVFFLAEAHRCRVSSLYLQVSSERVNRMKPFQRMNHFPGMLEICRKGGLSKHFQRLSAHFPKEFSFHPKSYAIPNQLEEFLTALRKNRLKVTSDGEIQNSLPAKLKRQ